MKQYRFFDPLYGAMPFTDREMSLILSPEIQRLRYVRMCNINSLLISGASEPSRFEHVVGVLHLAKQWTRKCGYSGGEAETIHYSALLHDVQTGPFGHSLEYVLADNNVTGDFRHDDVAHGAGSDYLQSTKYNGAFAGVRFNARETLGAQWGEVASAIKGGGRFGQVIAGTIDLDNIDNVVRLAFHVGLVDSQSKLAGLQLAMDMRLSDRSISLTNSGVQLLREWQEIRARLYSLLLYDWAEFSAKGMLTVMVELAVQYGILDSSDWILTDDELMSSLMDAAVGVSQEVGEIGRRLRAGDLYHPIALWRSPASRAYKYLSQTIVKREIEKSISKIANLKCIFHIILDKGKTRRGVSIFNRDSKKTEMVGENSDDLLIGIFLSREPTERQRLAILSHMRNKLNEVGVHTLFDLDDPVAALYGKRSVTQPNLV